jgi:hypothetical protein
MRRDNDWTFNWGLFTGLVLCVAVWLYLLWLA